MKIYFDTSILVAASVEGHPHFTPALTRAPFTPPVYPSEAWKVIEASILPHFEVITLSAGEYKGLVEDCSVEGIIGGRVYDVIHIRSARKAKADRLYTFNVRDFRAIAPEDFCDRICAP